MAVSVKKPEKKTANIRKITFGDLTWIDISEPTREATAYLAETYKFNVLDLDDALSSRQLSKIEEYPGYLFVIFHLPVFDKKTRVSTRKQWSAFVGDNYLITLRPEELRAVDEMFRECEFNKDTCQEYLGQGSGHLLYRILDRALDAYFPVLDKILDQMDSIEDIVFSEAVEAAQELSILRRDIITQRRVMFPTRTLLIELEKKLKRFSKIDLTIYFSDLVDHMNKICETLDESTEIIEVFKDADYLQSGYHANRGIRVVVIMLAIIIPLLAIFGIYAVFAAVHVGTIAGGSLTLVLLLILSFVIGGLTVFWLRRRHLI